MMAGSPVDPYRFLGMTISRGTKTLAAVPLCGENLTRVEHLWGDYSRDPTLRWPEPMRMTTLKGAKSFGWRNIRQPLEAAKRMAFGFRMMTSTPPPGRRGPAVPGPPPPYRSDPVP